MDRIDIINKRIKEINMLNKKYIYNFSVTEDESVPLKYTLRAKDKNDFIVLIKCFETLKEVYMFIDGILSVLYIK